MPRVVPPVGPRNQPLLALVGEAPGRHEDAQGRPFVGPSGHLLDQMLSAAGITRNDCYITNVALERPPNNDFEARYYEGKGPNADLLDCRERLWKELKEVKPSVVVALGAEPLKALTQEHSIKSFRGTMIEKFGFRVLPTYHPAYILRSYKERPIVECDLKKALRQARNPTNPITHFSINPSFGEVIETLRQRPELLALDIETLGHKSGTVHTRTIGLAWNKHDAICIPLIRGGTHAWSATQEAEILLELRKLCESEWVHFLLQNHPFDCTVLERELGISLRNIHLDTMFAHHVLYPELPKGLDFLSSIYTDHPMYWGGHDTDDKLAHYNCLDCVVTYEAGEQIERELRDRGLWDFYSTLVEPSVAALTRTQNRGVRIDTDLREQVKSDTESRMSTILEQLRATTNPDFNPSSPKQVMDLAYKTWGLPVQRNPKSKSPTSDDDALQALSRKHPEYREPLLLIVEYRKLRTLLGTFINTPLRDGRTFTSYSPVAVTGRITSSSTFDGYGGNMQNIPRGDFRRQFAADPGKLLIKADLAQAEYRVLVWKARILRVIQRWIDDPHWSIHKWNASENIYKVPIDQLTKQQYQNSKNGVYGANYGIGAQKVSRMYNIDFQEAKFIIQSYHASVPEVEGVYQLEIREELQRCRKLVNPLGRERVFFGRMDNDTFRAGYSHYCQSTVADIINQGLVRLDAAGREVLLQVHDELVVQVPEADALAAAREVKEAMSVPIQFEGVEAPLVIPVEVEIGPNWFDVEKVEV